ILGQGAAGLGDWGSRVQISPSRPIAPREARRRGAVVYAPGHGRHRPAPAASGPRPGHAGAPPPGARPPGGGAEPNGSARDSACPHPPRRPALERPAPARPGGRGARAAGAEPAGVVGDPDRAERGDAGEAVVGAGVCLPAGHGALRVGAGADRGGGVDRLGGRVAGQAVRAGEPGGAAAGPAGRPAADRGGGDRPGGAGGGALAGGGAAGGQGPGPAGRVAAAEAAGDRAAGGHLPRQGGHAGAAVRAAGAHPGGDRPGRGRGRPPAGAGPAVGRSGDVLPRRGGLRQNGAGTARPPGGRRLLAEGQGRAASRAAGWPGVGDPTRPAPGWHAPQGRAPKRRRDKEPNPYGYKRLATPAPRPCSPGRAPGRGGAARGSRVKAGIRGGGGAPRLRPLTANQPKPMLPVGNRPIMEHIVRHLRDYGFKDIVVTVQFLASQVPNYFGDGSDMEVDLAYATEPTPLGTAGSVRNAAEMLAETFVVISGDALTDIDLDGGVGFHRRRGALATVVLKRMPNPLEFGIVITRDDGRIERFLEKPHWGQVFSDTINTGIYVLEPEVFEHIPEGQPSDFAG